MNQLKKIYNMKKISTLFKKNPDNLGRVINEVAEENKWVLSYGIPTVKFDGTSCAVIKGNLYKRFDLKKGRVLPPNSIPCQEPDEKTGHHPHWTPCSREDKSDKYHFEAFDRNKSWEDGTYELIGPKIQGNPEGVPMHQLIRHGSIICRTRDFSFEALKIFLDANNMEGIVFHNIYDNRMCKIRKKDFGFKR